MLIKLGQIWQAQLVVLHFFTKHILDQLELAQCGNSNITATIGGGCAKIAGDVTVTKWVPTAYCALYKPECD